MTVIRDFFFHFPQQGQLDHFQFFDITNNTPMNIFRFFFVDICMNFFKIYTQIKIEGYKVAYVQLYKVMHIFQIASV